MSIRSRLSMLVAILVAITTTVLLYLCAAFVDTRQQLAEADAALEEFEHAMDTGATIAQLRLEILRYLASGLRSTYEQLLAQEDICVQSFRSWVSSSQASLDVGIENEAADVVAIENLSTRFMEELAVARGVIAQRMVGETVGSGRVEKPYAFFVEVLEVDAQRIMDDDVFELNTALDGVLLSMGTTPWIAWIGPSQLATARATAAEIRAAREVRDRLLHQAFRLAACLADSGPEAQRELSSATTSLEIALRQWTRSTRFYEVVTGEPAPPYCAQFMERSPIFQQYVHEVLDSTPSADSHSAQTRPGVDTGLSLEDELLHIVELSLATERKEFRDMLHRLTISTGVAGVGGITVTCVLLLSALVLFLTTARGMLSALDRLRTGTEIIGGGAFDYRVNLATNDELGMLGANFDAMAEKLHAQNEQRKHLEAELLRNERLATLGQVIATVSHEIRNPLGTIQTSLYTLRRRTGDQGDAVQKSLDRAERSVLRCDRIIEELLDYTRTREPDRVHTRLDEWLSVVLDDFNVPPEIEVYRALDSRATVYIDRNRIQGCVVNLLSNACQSMLERSGDPSKNELRIESAIDDGRIVVRIADTGPGMTPHVLAKVFEPMYSTRNFGVGLGLPIVRKYMEQHGGSVEINSATGRGTVATLCFAMMGMEDTQNEES